MASASKKRMSPGAGEERDAFDIEITDSLQKKLETVSRDILRAELANDRASQKCLAPVYAKRREVLKTIPKFWPVTLLNTSAISPYVQHVEDRKAFLALEDVWVVRDPVESRTFTIEFHFSENPFFSDKVLKKEYRFVPKPTEADDKPDEHGITESMLDFEWEKHIVPQAMKISWKSDAVNLTKLYPRVTEREEEVSDAGSFFNFFEKEADPFDIGLVLANDVYPDAIDWFTGKADAGLEMSDEEDSEDEDEDEDETEEIDLEKPESKKQRRA